jgi:hypothetical protein
VRERERERERVELIRNYSMMGRDVTRRELFVLGMCAGMLDR